jgi:hypothetical protein
MQCAHHFRQVIIDAAGHVEVDGQTVLFRGRALHVVVLMERRNAATVAAAAPFRNARLLMDPMMDAPPAR